MKEIDYYKNNEILENTYYQIPQEVFVIAYMLTLLAKMQQHLRKNLQRRYIIGIFSNFFEKTMYIFKKIVYNFIIKMNNIYYK